MFTGKAIGGPRDGVKLTAPLSWDGRVLTSDKRVVEHHPGYYAWSAYRQTWYWHADAQKPTSYGKHAY